MKLIANIKLTPTRDEAVVLRQTLERANEACNWLSEQAAQTQTLRQYAIHKAYYRQLRERFGLTAQMAVRCIAKVAGAYKSTKPKKGQNAAPKCQFRKHSAQPYDDRIIAFKANDTISLWTLDGRKKIKTVMGKHQRELLKHQKGEIDLMFIRGNFYLAVVCDIDEQTLSVPTKVLG